MPSNHLPCAGQASPVRGKAFSTSTSSRQQLAVTYRAMEDLKPNSSNPRLHSKKQVEQIANSIATFGFNVPLLVNDDLRVLAGHGRLQAAKMLGMGEVPTISVNHLSEAQATAFMIADNRLTEISKWDEKLLAEQLKFLTEAELDFSVDVTGFLVPEVDLLLEALTPAPKGDTDPADVVPDRDPGVPVSRTGDLWLLDRHRVLCGNSLHDSSYAVLMEEHRAAMVIADAPYNVPIAGHAGGLGSIQHKNFAMASGENARGGIYRLSRPSMQAAGSAYRGRVDSLHFYGLEACLRTAGRGQAGLLGIQESVHLG